MLHRFTDTSEFKGSLHSRSTVGSTQTVEASLQVKNLAAGLPFVQRSLLQGDTDTDSHLSRAFDHVVASDSGLACAGTQQSA